MMIRKYWCGWKAVGAAFRFRCTGKKPGAGASGPCTCSPLLELILIWLTGLASPLPAQQPWSNLRTRTIDARQPLQLLDTLTVAVPLLAVTDSMSGEPVGADVFSLENNYLRIDTLRLFQWKPDVRRLTVAYRVLPADLGRPIRRLDTAVIRRAMGDEAIEFDYTPYAPPSKPWETAGLVSNGAYTRGLSFGNNQNLAFNSNLNLQLSGRLGNDLEISAALSDNSIPLQPDGTTRQLQEFDRVFVQLRRKNLELTAGDFDLTRPTGYFSSYFKRVQGAMVRGLGPPPPGGERGVRGYFARRVARERGVGRYFARRVARERGVGRYFARRVARELGVGRYFTRRVARELGVGGILRAGLPGSGASEDILRAGLPGSGASGGILRAGLPGSGASGGILRAGLPGSGASEDILRAGLPGSGAYFARRVARERGVGGYFARRVA
ncbi:MAG: hypothetical protein IPH12_00135 [Saprospirales bacterium]|nr:hypothetical protein [Saprospirales bacterium]